MNVSNPCTPLRETRAAHVFGQRPDLTIPQNQISGLSCIDLIIRHISNLINFTKPDFQGWAEFYSFHITA